MCNNHKDSYTLQSMAVKLISLSGNGDTISVSDNHVHKTNNNQKWGLLLVFKKKFVSELWGENIRIGKSAVYAKKAPGLNGLSQPIEEFDFYVNDSTSTIVSLNKNLLRANNSIVQNEFGIDTIKCNSCLYNRIGEFADLQSLITSMNNKKSFTLGYHLDEDTLYFYADEHANNIISHNKVYFRIMVGDRTKRIEVPKDTRMSISFYDEEH